MAVSVWPTAAQSRDIADHAAADYDIEVALDPESHELTGTQTVRWRNTTGVATSEVWFHLYLNAFANTESTYSREVELDPMAYWRVEEGGWGWTRISRLSLAGGADLFRHCGPGHCRAVVSGHQRTAEEECGGGIC